MSNGKIFNIIKASKADISLNANGISVRDRSNNVYGQRLMEPLLAGRDKHIPTNIMLPLYYSNYVAIEGFSKTIIANRAEEGESIELFPYAIKEQIIARNPLLIGNLPQVQNDGFLLHSDIAIRSNSTNMKPVSSITVNANVDKFNIVVIKFRSKCSLPSYLNPGFTVINDVVNVGTEYISGLAFDDTVGNSGITVETFNITPNVDNTISIRNFYEANTSENHFIVARYKGLPVYENKDWIKCTINRISNVDI